MLYFIIWLIIIIVLFLLYKLTSSHINKITEHLYSILDDIIYDYNIKIIRNKDKFYDWEKALDVLYLSQSKIINTWYLNLDSLYKLSYMIRGDIEYVEGLLWKQDLFDFDSLYSLDEYLYSSKFLIKINKFAKYLLWILTLWVSIIFIR